MSEKKRLLSKAVYRIGGQHMFSVLGKVRWLEKQDGYIIHFEMVKFIVENIRESVS